jgi:anti-sigma factor RsiW
MQCRDFRELADTYLDEELLVETSHEVLRHLEQCPGCRRELAARRELRGQMRRGFNEAPEYHLPPGFETRLRANLREKAQPRRAFLGGLPAYTAMAVCLLLAVIAGWRWLRVAASPATSEVATASHAEFETLLTEVSHKAVGDHKDCALTHNLEENPISLEEAAQKFDGAYKDLKQTVAADLKQNNSAAEIIATHACVWQGRRFAHLVMRQNGEIVSLLVTDVKAHADAPKSAETFAQMRCRSLGGYQVSCFETPRHVVLVVSSLPEEQNLAFARNLAPSLLRHLA